MASLCVKKECVYVNKIPVTAADGVFDIEEDDYVQELLSTGLIELVTPAEPEVEEDTSDDLNYLDTVATPAPKKKRKKGK